MAIVIGVRFAKNSKIYYFDPSDVWPAIGDGVICDTSRGPEYGVVAASAREVDDDMLQLPLRKVISMATEADVERVKANEKLGREAMLTCKDKIVEHKLEMKLIDVEVAFDNSKMVFYFTANGRVDFRELVKDLASIFKTRIELRQIGVRDEAKLLGGLGPCGRPICCGSFLSNFQPVSIKMAKEQNLSLNPTKISGLCGRLMCCLKYEEDYYEMMTKRLPRGPRHNDPRRTGHGRGHRRTARKGQGAHTAARQYVRCSHVRVRRLLAPRAGCTRRRRRRARRSRRCSPRACRRAGALRTHARPSSRAGQARGR